jgi:hypothetical protein
VFADTENKRIYSYDSFNRQLSKLLHEVEVNAHQKSFIVRKGSHKIHKKDNQNDQLWSAKPAWLG